MSVGYPNKRDRVYRYEKYI